MDDHDIPEAVTSSFSSFASRRFCQTQGLLLTIKLRHLAVLRCKVHHKFEAVNGLSLNSNWGQSLAEVLSRALRFDLVDSG